MSAPAPRRWPARLVRAGLTLGIVDALWAVVLTLAYGRTITRLWQGVAAAPFGSAMFDGGAPAALLGLGVHFTVAFTWAAVFLFAATHSTRLRALIARPAGMMAVAAIYGPCIWVVMSLAVIPLATHQATAITGRWVIQLCGHAAFVGLPVVWSVARSDR